MSTIRVHSAFLAMLVFWWTQRHDQGYALILGLAVLNPSRKPSASCVLNSAGNIEVETKIVVFYEFPLVMPQAFNPHTNQGYFPCPWCTLNIIWLCPRGLVNFFLCNQEVKTSKDRLKRDRCQAFSHTHTRLSLRWSDSIIFAATSASWLSFL